MTTAVSIILIVIVIIAAIGIVMLFDINNNRNQYKKAANMNLDSANLETRLLELSKTKYEGKLSPGAMCYLLACLEDVDYTCPYCNKTIKNKYTDYILHEIKEIDAIVRQIKRKGYDVVLDRTEFCEQCSKQNIDHPSLIFKIRFSENADYHVVKSDIVDEYQCLLQFILGADKYKGFHGEEEALHDNIDIIQKMTGLGKNLPIKKK